jgi:hypothetical protein
MALELVVPWSKAMTYPFKTKISFHIDPWKK